MLLFDHIQFWSKTIHDVTVSMFSFGFSFVLFFNTWAAASLFLIKRLSSLWRKLEKLSFLVCFSSFQFSRESHEILRLNGSYLCFTGCDYAKLILPFFPLCRGMLIMRTFYFFEENKFPVLLLGAATAHTNVQYISYLLWQQNNLLQKHKWRIFAINTYPWKHVTKRHNLLRWRT